MSEKPFTGAVFYEYLNEHKLMGSRCKTCGEVHVPPRPGCAACAGSAVEWVEMSGQGALAAYTVIHIAPTAMIEAGYDRNTPYCTGVVALAEGPRISAQILDVDVRHPETIEIGTPLEIAFIERGEGAARRTYLAFRPEK
ncbi:MAG: Zn-ribbon domain-containing OB-fold protein [Anaerolineae bacterium]|nr:Zn-ribbon domain-containing OB-fold protein [Anaerolineae bacterium]